ncbi:MAG: hypothetical protein KME04_04290 [Pleurocapsa minor GSE-CHR-MK-17-07R]|jgi:hypothetical protein|nr:hypothetical protein [Pleurocapsa minor GSE-CHR-MK 17-07R]
MMVAPATANRFRYRKWYIAWSCFVLTLAVILCIGIEYWLQRLASMIQIGGEYRILALLNVATMVLLLGVVCISATLIFWKAQSKAVGLLLATTMMLYWSMNSTPFDLLTKSENTPLAALFAPVILTLRAASLPLALALLFSFPDGKFAPRWSRWLVAAYTLLTMIYLIFPDFPTNTVYGATWRKTLELSFVTATVPFMIGIVAQVVRFRRASPEQRSQIKWTALGMTTMVAGTILYYAVYILFPPTALDEGIHRLELLRQLIQLVLAVIVPSACFMIAIFRYRLWSVNNVIRRTLIYSVLTTILAVIYFGGIILTQQIFRAATGETQDIAIVISTLLIAALFSPIRRRVQNVIDRRLYRRKYDVEKTLAEFQQNLRDEVDMETLKENLVGVVSETMQPDKIALWVRESSTK